MRNLSVIGGWDMKYISRANIVVCVSTLFIIFFQYASDSFKAGVSTPFGEFSLERSNVDLYTFIGIDKQVYETYKKARAQALKDAENKFKQEKDAVSKEIKKLEDDIANTEKLPVSGSDQAKNASLKTMREKLQQASKKEESINQKIRSEFIKDFYTKNTTWQATIKDACKKTTNELREERSKLRVEVTGALSSFEKSEKEKRMYEIDDKLKKMTNVCAALYNSESRQKYDETLFAKKPVIINPFSDIEQYLNEATVFNPDRKVMLNDFAGWVLEFIFELFPPPPFVAKIFNKSLEIRNLKFLPRPSGADVKYGLGFSGVIQIASTDVTLTFLLIKDIYGKNKFMISMGLPGSTKPSQISPYLSPFDIFPMPSGRLTFSTFEGSSKDIRFEKGFTISALWDVFYGPFAYLNALKDKAGSMKGLLFESRPIEFAIYMKRSNVSQMKAALIVPMRIGLDYTKMKAVPGWFSRVINQTSLNEVRIEIFPVAQEAENRSVSTIKADVTDIHDKLTESKQKLDAISEKGSVEYMKAHDEYNKLQADYERLQREERYVERKQKEEERKKTSEGTRSSLSSGIKKQTPIIKDFEVLGEEMATISSSEKSESDSVATEWKQKIHSYLSVTKGFQADISAKAEMILGTQQAPLIAQARGSLIPPGKLYPQGYTSLAFGVHNMLELGWLAIGNVEIALDWDVMALEAAILAGVPVTGISIKGQVDLGKPGASRASLNALGGISFMATDLPNFIFQVGARNIQFSDIVNYAYYLATKKNLYDALAKDRLPQFTIKKIEGYLAAGAGKIGGKSIEPGASFELQTILFDYPFGGKLGIKAGDKKYRLYGYMYGPRIEWKDRIIMYGRTEKESPYFEFDFDPDNWKAASFIADGTVIIPPIGMNTMLKLYWKGKTLESTFRWKWEAMDVLVALTFNTAPKLEIPSEYSQLKSAVEKALAKVPQNSIEGAIAAQFLKKAKSLDLYGKYYEAFAYLQQAHRLVSQKTSDSQAPLEFTELSYIQKAAKIGWFSGPSKNEIKKLQEIAVSCYYWLYKAAAEAQSYRSILNKKSDINSETKEKIEGLINKLIQTRNRFNNDLLKKSGDIAKMTELYNEFEPQFKEISNSFQKLYEEMPDESKSFESRSKKEKKPEFMQKQQKEISSMKDRFWGMNMRFVFTGEFSKFISKQAIPYLRKKKEQILKKLDDFTDWISKKQDIVAADAEYNKTKIETMKKELEKLKQECSALPMRQQLSCRGKIVAKQAAIQSREKLYQRYLQGKKSIVKSTGNITKQVVQSRYVRGFLEKSLEITSRGLEFALKATTIVEVKEFAVSLTSNELSEGKLPLIEQFTAQENFSGLDLTLSLSNLQFDFKNPVQTGTEIFGKIYDQTTDIIKQAFTKGMQKLTSGAASFGSPDGGATDDFDGLLMPE